MAAMEKNNKNLNVPNLRFPEFSGEWERCTIGDITRNFSLRNKDKIQYPMFSVTNSRGFVPQSEQFEDREMIGEDIKAYKIIHEGDFAYNPARINVGSIAKYDKSEPCMISSLYVCFKALPQINNEWLMQLLKTPKMNFYYNVNGEGGVRVYLFYPNFARIRTSYPSLAEQQKIASFLSIIDQRIETQKKIIEDLKKLKDAIRTKLFTSLESHCNEYDEIRNMLHYEQPSAYLVNSTEYSEDYPIPVLTANKAFILGYTDEEYGVYDKGDCIIFDDFTMDLKYVTFPFKIKSSAIKILTPRQNIDLYFIYEYFLYLGLVSEEHKRHYISEIESMSIIRPQLKEQRQISQSLQSLEMQVGNAITLQKLLAKQKQHLLSQMFI